MKDLHCMQLCKKLFWAKSYFGRKAILGEKLFWVKSYFGRKAILGEKLFWVKKGHICPPPA
jgi:hypothetical protein